MRICHQRINDNESINGLCENEPFDIDVYVDTGATTQCGGVTV